MATPKKTERIQNVKYAPPPPGVPVYGKKSSSVSFLGRANYATALQTKNFIFGIEARDRLKHMYVIGKSGSGKSKFLELLLRQDIARGDGVCLIDPYGEIAENILDFIPEKRKKDCVYLDCEDSEHPISINPFFGVSENVRHHYIEFLIQIFHEYLGSTWVPEMEYVLRYLFQTLLDYPDASFFSILLVLTNKEYRLHTLTYVKDPVIRSFWMEEFEEKKSIFEEKVILPLKTRLSKFFFDPTARLLFSQPNHMINFSDAILNKKIILIKLPKGIVSDEIVSLIGSFFLSAIRVAGFELRAQGKISHPFYLYVDEFQNLQTNIFIHFLPEAAKAGIAITLAHRYMGQFSDSIRGAIFGNVGNIVIFRVSGEDAIRLRPEMAPIFEAKDMLNLGTGEFYIKMTIRGEAYDPFSGEVLRVFPPRKSVFRDEIISSSRIEFSVTKNDAEKFFQKELKNYSGDVSGGFK